MASPHPRSRRPRPAHRKPPDPRLHSPFLRRSTLGGGRTVGPAVNPSRRDPRRDWARSLEYCRLGPSAHRAHLDDGLRSRQLALALFSARSRDRVADLDLDPTRKNATRRLSAAKLGPTYRSISRRLGADPTVATYHCRLASSDRAGRDAGAAAGAAESGPASRRHSRWDRSAHLGHLARCGPDPAEAVADLARRRP